MISSYIFWRYIGSKETMWHWIRSKINNLEFNNVIDVFGGTGIMSYEFLNMDKSVIYNDLLSHMVTINKGLLQATSKNHIDIDSIKWLWEIEPEDNLHKAKTHFSKYFLNDELEFIDRFIQNFHLSDINEVEKGLLMYILTQSCLDKRPFANYQNSFLKLRTKTRDGVQTWDKSFELLFAEKINRVNDYTLNNSRENTKVSFSNLSSNWIKSEFIVENNIDLVYLDPPFVPKRKKSRQLGNYVNNYHFNEFLDNYYKFDELIDMNSDLRKPKQTSWLTTQNKSWLQPEFFPKSLETIVNNVNSSNLILSYRDDSFISIESISNIIDQYYENVEIHSTPHVYKNRETISKFNDVLFIATK